MILLFVREKEGGEKKKFLFLILKNKTRESKHKTLYEMFLWCLCFEVQPR